MINFEDALKILNEEVQFEQKTEKIRLQNASGRVTSEAVFANYDAPLFDNSAMDGYAICDSSEKNLSFVIKGRIAAGDDASLLSLNEGESVRIFTGAEIPKNTTAVVMQEATLLSEDKQTIKLETPIKLGKNIRRKGEEIAKGALLLKQDTPITERTIGLLASQGVFEILVYKKLNVAVASTGSELINIDETLSKGQIYDANRLMLISALKSSHNVFDAGIIRDNFDETCKILHNLSANNDVIILSGGASVGEEDHVKNALNALGEIKAWKLAIKPGKPFGFGFIGKTAVFILPGNPVASFVTYYLFVYPLLRKALGLSALKPEQGKATFNQTKLEPRREFLRGIYQQNDRGEYLLSIDKNQGSAMLSALSMANCLIEIAPNTEVAEGQVLNFYPLDRD